MRAVWCARMCLIRYFERLYAQTRYFSCQSPLFSKHALFLLITIVLNEIHLKIEKNNKIIKNVQQTLYEFCFRGLLKVTKISYGITPPEKSLSQK